MSDALAKAPDPSFRLVPSRFPPIGLFDTVATAADLEAVMELVGWTDDSLVADRLARMPRTEWVYGRPNASVVMATFLHIAPGGMRFNGPDLGAWYAAGALRGAITEVAHHLRREAVARDAPAASRRYSAYEATLSGDYVDICGHQRRRAEIYDPARYAASQALGESVRASGGAGILYDSLRYAGGVNVAAYRPTNVTAVRQAAHYDIAVQTASRRIDVKRLGAAHDG